MRFVYVLVLFCAPITTFGQCVNSCPQDQPKNVTYDSVESYNPEGFVATNNCSIVLTVPTDAIVKINGKPTTSKGTTRKFKSIDLKDGLDYKYVITVYTKEKDKWFEQSETILMRSNTKQSLTFE